MIQPSLVIEQVGEELKLLHLSANAMEAEAAFMVARRDPNKKAIALWQNGGFRTEANPADEIARDNQEAAAKKAKAEALENKAKIEAQAKVDAAQKTLADAQAKLAAFAVEPTQPPPEQPAPIAPQPPPEQSSDEQEKPKRAKK